MSPTTSRPRYTHAPIDGPQADGHLGRLFDRRFTHLRRFQWAVRAALALGVAASVCANVLHAQHNPIAQTIAAWPPLALMLTVELISRVPVYRRVLAAVRLFATACIAGIAAYVSYFHMAAVVSRYGEHQPNPYLLPISVDGLIAVASVSLVELAGRIRAIRDDVPETRPANSPTGARPALWDSETVSFPPPERARRNGHASTAPQEVRPLPPSASPPIERSAPATTIPPNQTISSPTEPPPADKPEEPDEGCADTLDPELAELLPAARDARDALRRQHRGLTRDSLAAQLRHDGHTIRTSRVSALLNLLRNDEPTIVNGRSSSAPS